LKSSSNKISKIFSAGDIIAIAVFIIGIVWAIYVDTMALRIIAIAVAFTAIVALASSLLQKSSYRVETGKFTIKKSSEKLQTTIVKDEKAKHTTIDNFEQITANSNQKTGVNFSEDEGFVVVGRTQQTPAQQTITPKNKKEYTVDFGAEDVGSFRVITHSTNVAKQVKTESITSKIEEQNNIFNDENSRNIVSKNENNTVETPTVKNEKIIENTVGACPAPAHTVETHCNASLQEEQPQGLSLQDDTVVIASETKQFPNKKTDDLTENKTVENPVEIAEQASNAENFSSHNDSEKTNEDYSQKANNQVKDSQPAVALEMDLPVSLIADLDQKMDSSIAEFGYLISRFLVIIHSVLEANTVGFVWVNSEKKTLLFDSYLSNNEFKDLIITNKKINFGNDIISQIVANVKPQILSEINPAAELDLIPYYLKPVGTNSFIGIPIIFENTVVGVLCADSNKEDAYDKATVAFLGHFTKIFSALFSSYSNNYSNENANKTLMLLNKFTGLVAKKGCSFNQICAAVIDFVVELYDCSSLGICYFNDSQKAWTVCSYKSINPVDEKYFSAPVSLENSIIGKSIANCQVISLSKVPQNYLRVNEFEHKDENISFISVPIKSATDTYGALFIEANESSYLNSTVDFEILKAICNHTGEILEKIQLVTLFNNYVSVETNTGILTEITFKQKILQEVLRSNEVKQSVSLALISLDKNSSFEDENKKNKIFDYIISTVNQQLKPYEIIGRVKSDVIGIVMVNRDSVQSKLALERIRQQIATQYIEFLDEKLVVTVSIGIAAIRPNDTFESFTSNATVALYQAQKRSNCVQVFE